jgi:glycosyltransferase involved in cell wall biosynthesis
MQKILILIDHHPLSPFIVRSHQFLSRAAAFHQNAPPEMHVQIWIPAPQVCTRKLAKQIHMELPSSLIKFGPQRIRRFLGQKITLTFLFRGWVKTQLRTIAKTNKAVVYLRTPSLAAALIPTLQDLNVPFIFEPHEIFYKSARYPDRFKAIEERIYQSASLAIPISYPLADDLSKEFGVAAPLILPSGHNGALANISPYDSSAPPRFLYIGSLHKWKGLEPFLIATKDIKIPTDIVGDAGGLTRMKEFVKQHQMNHVTLHGHQAPEKLMNYYNPGSICILPLSSAKIAQRYTSPLKLFEYLSAGRPVIIGRAPAVETIPGIDSVVMLVSNDWREAAESLLRSPEKAHQMALEGKQLSLQFNWSKIAKSLFDHPAFESLFTSNSKAVHSQDIEPRSTGV